VTDIEILFSKGTPKDYKKQVIPVDIPVVQEVKVVNPTSWDDIPTLINKKDFNVSQEDIASRIKAALTENPWNRFEGPIHIHTLTYEYEPARYEHDYWREERIVVYVSFSRPKTKNEKSQENRLKTAQARKEKAAKKRVITTQIKTIETLIQGSDSEDEMVLLNERLSKLQEELKNI